MIHVFPKIKLKELSRDDLAVVSNAVSSYSETLQELTESENTSQQHIHLSILTEFRFHLFGKITKRELAKKHTLKLEIHTGFVVYDALQFYSRQLDEHLEAAIVRRLIMELFSLLPFTKDHEKLSLMSNLNFNE